MALSNIQFNRESSYLAHRKDEAKSTPRSTPRIVPQDWDNENEEKMNARASQLQEAMQLRALSQQTDFEQGSRQLQVWLKSNTFFSAHSKRSRFLSFTYPLHVAAEQNDIEVIQLLLMHQADPFKVDSKGRTALQVAEKKDKQGSHRDAVTLLTTTS